jgi:hypothetical protein
MVAGLNESIAASRLFDKFALVICDNPNEFDTSMINANHIIILPDNGRRDHGHMIPKRGYSVSFS